MNSVFRGGSGLNTLSNSYIGLLTTLAAAGDTGTTVQNMTGTGIEVPFSGTNYTRNAIICNSSNWSNTNGLLSNSNAISWSGINWNATLVGAFVADAATGGQIYFFGQFAVAKTVSAGDVVQFGVGQLVINVNS
jgi:hypothetical protein